MRCRGLMSSRGSGTSCPDAARRTIDDRYPGGWVPEQRIQLEEAVRAHTAGSAYAGFQDEITGTLSPGKRADFVVFDRDIAKSPTEKLIEAQVRYTVVEGRVMYSRA